jgi:hypothetical protein
MPLDGWPYLPYGFPRPQDERLLRQCRAYKSVHMLSHQRHAGGRHGAKMHREGEPLVLYPGTRYASQCLLELMEQLLHLRAVALCLWMAEGDPGPHYLQAMVPGQIEPLSLDTLLQICKSTATHNGQAIMGMAP